MTTTTCDGERFPTFEPLVVSRVSIICADAESRIQHISPLAYEVLQWPPGSLEGKLLTETIIPERFRKRHADGLRTFVETGEGNLIGRMLKLPALTAEGKEIRIAVLFWAGMMNGQLRFRAAVRRDDGQIAVEL